MDDKVKVLEWPSQSLDLNRIEIFGEELKSKQGGMQTWLWQEKRDKIQATYREKLVEATQDIWAKLNIKKAMLLNTN